MTQSLENEDVNEIKEDENTLMNDNSNEDNKYSRLKSHNKNNNNKKSIEERAKTEQLPLQYAWTLWHTAPSSSGGWSDDYRQIAHFATVEDFWRLFNNISPPSLLAAGSSYHLFKGKVKPAWEDKFNEKGGQWTYRFGSNQGGDDNAAVNSANYAWYHSVLNMIGNNFKYSQDICGLVINIKKHGRGKIELWIRDASKKGVAVEIGEQFKQFNGASKRKKAEIDFMSFKDQLNSSRGNIPKIRI